MDFLIEILILALCAYVFIKIKVLQKRVFVINTEWCTFNKWRINHCTTYRSYSNSPKTLLTLIRWNLPYGWVPRGIPLACIISKSWRNHWCVYQQINTSPVPHFTKRLNIVREPKTSYSGESSNLLFSPSPSICLREYSLRRVVRYS